MGGIRKSRKKYTKPRKRWDRARIEEERVTKKVYGLRNKRELRVLETFIRKKRQNAKGLLTMPLELRVQREKELIASLARYAILPLNATLDDVLGLKTQEVLEKRLATIVWRKNLAKTPLQARQFIVHGHIAVGGEKITSPNYIVPKAMVDSVKYFGDKKLIIEQPNPKGEEKLKREFEAAGIAQKGAKENEGITLDEVAGKESETTTGVTSDAQ